MAIQVSIDVQIGNALRAIKEFEKKIKDLSNVASRPKDISALRGALSETKALKKDLALLAKQTKDTFGVFDAKEPLKALSAIEKKIEKIVTVGASKVSVGMAKKLKEPFEETTLAVNKTKKSIENVIATQKNLAKSTAYLADPLTKKFSTLKTPFQGVDAQIKSITTSATALSGRLTALQAVMATRKDYPYLNTTAFQVNKTKVAVAEIANIQKEMGRLSSTMSKQPLFATPETIGQLANLKAQFKEVSKEYENLRKPKKFPPLIANDVLGNVKEFQARLSTFDGSLAAIRTRVAAKGFGFNKEAINKELANIEVLKGSLKDISMFAQKRGVSREIRIANLTPFTQQFQMLQAQIKNAEKEAIKATQKIQAEFNRLKIGRVHLNLDGARESWRGFVKFFHENAYNIGSAMMSVGRNITMYFSAPLAIAAGFALRASGQFETAQVAFKALTDTATEGKYIFEELRDFSKVAPVDVNALFEGAKQMLGLGFAAKEVVPTLKIISEGLGAIGADAGVFSRIVLALSQIKGKGRLMAEEIRQIGNVGLISMVKVAEKFDLTVMDFLKKVEERAISGKQAVGAVMAVIIDRFSGFLELQAKTLPGRWKILTNHFKIFAAEFGTVLSGAFRVPENLTRLTAILAFLTDKVKNMNPVVLELTLKISGLVVAFGLLLTVLGGLVKMYSILQGLWVLAFTNPVTATIAVLLILIGTIALLISTMRINWKLALQDMETAWKKWVDELGIYLKDSWLGSIIDTINLLGEAFSKLDTKSNLSHYDALRKQLIAERGKTFVGPPEQTWRQRYTLSTPSLMESATGLENEQRKELERQTKEIMEAAKNFEGKIAQSIKESIKDIEGNLKKTLEANKLLAEAAKITGKEYNRAAEDIQAMETAMSSYANLGVGATLQVTKLANQVKNLSAESEATALSLDRIKSVKDIFKALEESVSDAGVRLKLSGDNAKHAEDLIKAYGKAIEDITALKISPEALDAIIVKLKELKVSPEVLTSFEGLKKELEGIKSERMIELSNTTSNLAQKINELGGSTSLLREGFEESNEELLASGNNYAILIEWVKTLSKEYKNLTKNNAKAITALNDYMLTLKPEIIQNFITQMGAMWDALSPQGKLDQLKAMVEDYNKAIENVVSKTSDAIKNIWNNTTMTFKDVWHKLLDDFVDIMSQMVAEYLKADKKMKANDAFTTNTGKSTTSGTISGAQSSGWVGAIIGAMAGFVISDINKIKEQEKQAKALIKAQKIFIKEFPIKLKEVLDDFVDNFKNVLGEFKEILFPTSKEALELQKTVSFLTKSTVDVTRFIDTMQKGIFKAFESEQYKHSPPVGSTSTTQVTSTRLTEFGQEQYMQFRKDFTSFVDSMMSVFPKITQSLSDFMYKHYTEKYQYLSPYIPMKGTTDLRANELLVHVMQLMLDLVTELGKNVEEITGVMVTRFTEIKSIVEDTVALYKEKLDFTKDMSEAITDIKREMLATPELFKEQQKDVLTLSTGLADFLDPQTQLAKINKIKEANYVLEVQEKRISDLKIDDARLTLDKIQEVKDANLDLWETVKTLISETFDLITQKAGFTQSIEDAITDIRRSVLTPTELYNEQLSDVNTILAQIASTADEQAKLPLYDKLREAYQSAYATAQQIYDPASIRSELEGLYKRSTTETSLESLREISGQIQGLERDLANAERGSKEAMDFAIQGLTSLGDQGRTSYDKLVAVNLDALGIQSDSSTWLEDLNKATEDWQTVIEANLKDLTKSGASAYDVMIAENLALLQIDTAQLDIQTQMANYLSVIETNMIIALKSLNLMALNSSKAITSADIADMMGISIEAMDAILGDSSPLMYLLSNLTTSMDDLFKTPATTETIPKLAQGGIVTSPTLAIIGEKGPEAVIPLSGKMLPRIETEYNSMDKELESLAKIALGGNTPQAKKDKKRGLISNAYENLGFSKVAKEMSMMFKTFKDIPKLAMGGVVTKPTLAMIGESGAEAVIPLNQMKTANVNINIEGAMVMDEITMSKWTRTLTKHIEKQQMRYA